MTSDDVDHYRRRAFAYGTTRGQLGFDEQKLHDMVSGALTDRSFSGRT